MTIGGFRVLFIVRHGLTVIGNLVATAVWLEFTRSRGQPVDAHAYWTADPNDLYRIARSGQTTDSYLYPPAFEVFVSWGRVVPFEVFVAIWRALLLAALVYLAGPLTILVLFTVPVASEINAGNIQILLALAIVLGFRWPASWAFVVLTKLTPGVGLAWFALRREWRALAMAAGATVLVGGVSFVLSRDAWFAYLALLVGQPAPAVAPYYLSFWTRLPFRPWVRGLRRLARVSLARRRRCDACAACLLHHQHVHAGRSLAIPAERGRSTDRGRSTGALSRGAPS